MVDNISRFKGAFIGFAIGDAFGFPCRGMSFDEICERFEKNGCLRLSVSAKTKTALFTDATQLMLFTADGILFASHPKDDNTESEQNGINYTEYVFYAYQLWLYTQIKTIAGDEYSWLFDKDANPYKSKLVRTKGMYQNRCFRKTNIDILSKIRNAEYGRISAPINNFSDSSAVKRVLSAGMFFNYEAELSFRAGADFAAITHTSPVSYLSAGYYCAVISYLINGDNIDNAIEKSLKILKTYHNNGEVVAVIEKVISLLKDYELSPLEAVDEIGTADNAAQVLGIALFSAALFEDSFENAIRLAVNHDGVSDACGALCGGILGVYHGIDFIPEKWIKKISHLKLIEDMAISLFENSYFNEEENINSEDEEGIENENPESDDDIHALNDTHSENDGENETDDFFSHFEFDDEYED